MYIWLHVTPPWVHNSPKLQGPYFKRTNQGYDWKLKLHWNIKKCKSFSFSSNVRSYTQPTLIMLIIMGYYNLPFYILNIFVSSVFHWWHGLNCTFLVRINSYTICNTPRKCPSHMTSTTKGQENNIIGVLLEKL